MPTSSRKSIDGSASIGLTPDGSGRRGSGEGRRDRFGGGVPIEVGGKIIGAIGCSGVPWPQEDALVCNTGARGVQ
jgi:hypothetical protein